MDSFQGKGLQQVTGRRQFVAIRFREQGRPYTYHNDGPPVMVGDRVKIDGKDGWQACTVESVTFVPPFYETKPIGGLVGDAQPSADKAVDDLFAGGGDADPA